MNTEKLTATELIALMISEMSTNGVDTIRMMVTGKEGTQLPLYISLVDPTEDDWEDV